MLRVLFLCAGLGLAGCSSLVAAGVARLAGLSPLTADPQGFVVAIDLPPGIAIPPGSAQILFQAARTDTGEASSHSYLLEESRTETGAVSYRIATPDLDRFRTQQTLIAGWEDAAPDQTTGSFSVSLAPCTTGAGPASDATVSVTLKLAEDQAFFPILRDAPLDQITQAGVGVEIAPCD
jgi:hypothetical protein